MIVRKLSWKIIMFGIIWNVPNFVGAFTSVAQIQNTKIASLKIKTRNRSFRCRWRISGRLLNRYSWRRVIYWTTNSLSVNHNGWCCCRQQQQPTTWIFSRSHTCCFTFVVLEAVQKTTVSVASCGGGVSACRREKSKGCTGREQMRRAKAERETEMRMR